MKALFVIDMQNICMGENHADFFKYDINKIVTEVNKAIENNKNNTVIYIRNLMKKNLLNKLAPIQCYDGTKEAELVDRLSKVSDHIYDKYSGNALTNRQLVDFLRQKSIDEIEVVGVDGGGCVSLTALGALNEDYKVVVNTKAIGTMFEKKKEKYFAKLRKNGAEFI